MVSTTRRLIFAVKLLAWHGQEARVVLGALIFSDEKWERLEKFRTVAGERTETDSTAPGVDAAVYLELLPGVILAAELETASLYVRDVWDDRLSAARVAADKSSLDQIPHAPLFVLLIIV